MPLYQLSQIKVMATPKFEPAFAVKGLADVPFEYSRPIAVIVGFHFGLVRAILHGLEDHYEAVFEIYENDPALDPAIILAGSNTDHSQQFINRGICFVRHHFGKLDNVITNIRFNPLCI